MDGEFMGFYSTHIRIHSSSNRPTSITTHTALPTRLLRLFTVRRPITPEKEVCTLSPHRALKFYAQSWNSMLILTGSIPVTLDFANILGLNVLLLPVGRGDDGAHSTDEKLDRDNYIRGTKLLGSYMYELAATSE